MEILNKPQTKHYDEKLGILPLSEHQKHWAVHPVLPPLT